jgi:hypothetical protein
MFPPAQPLSQEEKWNEPDQHVRTEMQPPGNPGPEVQRLVFRSPIGPD